MDVDDISPDVKVMDTMDNNFTKDDDDNIEVDGDVEEPPLSRPRLQVLVANMIGLTEENDESNWEQYGAEEITIDDINELEPEQYMDPEMVKKAKQEELDRFARMNVYEAVPRKTMERDADAKMVSVRWVVTNKGTRENPKAKARLVAREFNDGTHKHEMFASTPGLQSRRLVLSRATSRSSRRKTNKALMILDVKTAFLYGDARRSLYILNYHKKIHDRLLDYSLDDYVGVFTVLAMLR